MKLVAVTRVMNEDDIVEAFVRHHNGPLDHHLFLDNGSVDRTVPILRALQDEGLKLTVLQNKSPIYMESYQATSLFQLAVRELGADWVLFLDTDEFIDARATTAGWRAHLEAVPPEVTCLTIRSVQYFDTGADDPGDLLVPRRVRRRQAVRDASVSKVFVRATLVNTAQIDAGQHNVLINGQVVPGQTDEQLWIAHYFRRNPHQLVWKCVLGRLKVVAAGRRELDRNRSEHYTPVFEHLRDDPAKLLRSPGWLSPSYDSAAVTDDPIRYEGGALRYTEPMDAPMKAIRILLNHAEFLAQEMGQLIDSNTGVRLQIEGKSSRWGKLF